MAQTEYEVLGKTGTGDEIFSEDEMAAIQTCADNINAIVDFSINYTQYRADTENFKDQAAASAASADASQVAAAGSASSAATNASQVAINTSQVAADAAAAGTAASEAQTALAQVNAVIADFYAESRVLPPGGATGTALVKTSAADYAVAWSTVAGGGGATSLDGLVDVDLSTTPPIANDYLKYDGSLWKPAAQAAATNLDSLSDVVIASPQIGQAVMWDGAKFTNLTPTALSGGYVPLNATEYFGPGTVTFSADMIGKLTRLYAGGGEIDLAFDDTVAVPAGQIAEALFRIYDGDVNSVNLVGDYVAGPLPTLDPLLRFGRGSGVAGTSLPLSANTTVIRTILAGLSKSALVIYTCNPTNAANPTGTDGYELNGVVYPWHYRAEAALSTTPHMYIARMNLGDVDLPYDITVRPHWVDHGGNNNCTSFTFALVVANGVDQFDPVKVVLPIQDSVQDKQAEHSIALTATEINRLVYYYCVRRSNAGDLPLNLTGATLHAEGETDTTANSSAMRWIAGYENGVANATNAAVVDWLNGTIDAVNTRVTFAFNPVPENMRLITPNRAAPVIDKHGLTLGVIYDQANKLVEVDF